MARHQLAESAQSPVIDTLQCPTCNTTMHLSRITLLKDGYEQRSFVCEHCDRWDNIVCFKFD
jgi:hypothetical protein